MQAPVLATKLFVPPARPHAVLRPRLIARLNEGLSSGRKLTLISAPAGSGKTTLVSEWIASCGRSVAWLSLDEGDNDPACFLTYLVAALQTIAANVGVGALAALQSSQPPSSESILAALLNEITTLPDNFDLVLDDYHVIDSKPVDEALTFLLKHLPPPMQLVIATREDPQLPLARLRARGQLTELRSADLCFSPSEAGEFLNRVMGLSLSPENIAALETRTEGWIAGLQLAALSMQGCQDATSFIQSFTGSHRFVLDYLIEEVLRQQSEDIQTFLLRTSVLDRLCGSLCDAVLGSPTASGQEILEYLEHVNLFIVPLDNERRWYRYHHLFAELLRQRLHQSASPGNEEDGVAEYHIRASAWYEDHGLEIEAFRHAAAANDVERAGRIIEGRGIPLHSRSAVSAILDWLASLPKSVLEAMPSLCARYATISLVAGQTTGVEEILQTAEASIAAALQNAEPDDKTRDLIGQIATSRATLALTRYQADAMITQARRAQEYLPHDNFFHRARAIWTLGFAYQVQGNRGDAGRAFSEAIAISQASDDIRMTIVATISLGVIQELENHLHQATETFRRGLQLAGDHPQPVHSEAHLGLAHIFYEWNNLEAAEQHGEQSLQLAQRYDRTIDRYILSEVFLARLKAARGDMVSAAAMLVTTSQSVHQNNFEQRIPEVAAAQVLVELQQGNVAAAEHFAQAHELLICQARIHLAKGDPSAALAVLSPLREQMEAKGWQNERLKVMILQAVAHHAHGEEEKAIQLLGEALALAQPGGFVRLFLDEGAPMAKLLSVATARETIPAYAGMLLRAFAAEKQLHAGALAESAPPLSSLTKPLSRRELEVLMLLAEGLSNQEIGDRLFVALDTIKGHNRKIFEKLEVKRRTEAINRARELSLL
jgi:LuxR family transcriptional regulator, maltose regulon positive regulatory protein